MKWTDFKDFADYMAFTKGQKKAWKQRPDVRAHERAYGKEYRISHGQVQFGPKWSARWFVKYWEEKAEKAAINLAKRVAKEALKPIEIQGVAYKDLTKEQRSIRQRWSHRNSPKNGWRKRNPEKNRESNKKSRSKNIDKVRKADVISKRNRLKTDIGYRLLRAIRNRFRSILSAKKLMRTHELIGCSLARLKEYLESQFIGIMSWENYGTAWHIDHKVPCKYFDMSLRKEQLDCFHFTNLRPLWAKTNLRRFKKGVPVQQELQLA